MWQHHTVPAVTVIESAGGISFTIYISVPAQWRDLFLKKSRHFPAVFWNQIAKFLVHAGEYLACMFIEASTNYWHRFLIMFKKCCRALLTRHLRNNTNMIYHNKRRQGDSESYMLHIWMWSWWSDYSFLCFCTFEASMALENWIYLFPYLQGQYGVTEEDRHINMYIISHVTRL